MKRLSLQDWAALGELVATLGVIVSLVLVAYSINSNSKIMMATNDNLIYEIHDQIFADVATDKGLASIFVKFADGEELTAIEKEQHSWHLWRSMNIWEMAFDRYNEGLLSEDKWAAWDISFAGDVISPQSGMTKEEWDAGKYAFGREFIEHIDSIYSRR